MFTVSFAANLRGSAGSAANLVSAKVALLVIPSEASNLLFADRVAALPLSHAAPAPPAARRINSLRFMTPPLRFSAPIRSLVWTPASPLGYHWNLGARRPHHTPAANRPQVVSYGTAPSFVARTIRSC